MASMRDIKRRIKGITSTEQITKAMKLVSSVRLQREREKFEKNKTYVEKMKEVIAIIAKNSNGVSSIYLESPAKVKKTAYIVLSSDRGLAGGYNQNIFKEIIRDREKEEDREEEYFVMGRKAKQFLDKNNLIVKKANYGISEEPHYDDAADLGMKILERYENGEYDQIKLIYTSFHSIINQEVVTFDLLPVDVSNFEERDTKGQELNFEPNENQVLDYLMPKYVLSTIYGAMIEASVCEEASRMTAMDSATENASELIDGLTLKFNRARQAAITKELTEIVGGANALS